MNIVHFTHGKVNPFGESGMSRTVYYLNKYQKLAGHNSQIWSVVDGVSQQEIYHRDAFVDVRMFPRVRLAGSRKNGILSYIRDNRKNIDIVHFHLMWMIDKNFVAHLLRELHIPYVVTAHGAYTADKIRDVWWKKLPAKYAYELKFLNEAHAIHAVCPEESSSLREFGVKTKVFALANGIELSEIPQELDHDYFASREDIRSKAKCVWVGNLKPCKNIDGLIEAVSLIPSDVRKGLAFILVGPEGSDAKGHAEHLQRLSRKRGVEKQIHFWGPLYGRDKYSALVSSDIYIHTSWSEVISFAVMEAMACAKPCLITRTSNVSYLYRHDFFEMVEPYPDDIARGIREMLQMRERWKTLGLNGQGVVHRELTWQAIANKMMEDYQRLV